MKRYLLLFFVLLFLLVSCSLPEKQTVESVFETKKDEPLQEQIQTKEAEDTTETVEVEYMTVEAPLSENDLLAIPIANSSMNADDLRKICVDYFNLAISFRYIPNKTVDYTVTSYNYDCTLKEGQIYGGLPYVSLGSGNLYRLMDFYDPQTGILDVSIFAQNMAYFGNVCATGAEWGWARVVNSATLSWTANMTPANGFLSVGPYETVAPDALIFGEDGNLDCRDIAAKNSEQVMFESYALTLPADGIVNNGHVRMVTDNAYIARDPDDNTILGDESYLICSDQICYNTTPEYLREQSDGTKYRIAGGQNIKYTFSELYRDGYLPFTFAEFQGTDPVEPGTAFLDHKADTITASQLAQSTLQTNYVISDIYFVIQDAGGNTALSFAYRSSNLTTKNFPLSSISSTYFKKYTESGTNSLEIVVQLGNGERLTAYKGTLVEK